ncbi:uncharacterized protein F5147DRAFT_777702 [Suillus discolor]|uniref:DUF6533 domain-containing protein n=1 Tax=Suillus discolor TaxID=1912936 RepID=A0A9P7EYM3_9AGAM|nr:uncharacterized protein F5147DRAFT_777702 [Suillus discolor]KAG2098461.1 hypothetical protein F5147DRAFT_777702 [Suillus discolor]
MTIVSNDPSRWPTINFDILLSHWEVAAGVVVVYDWVLTLGQEIELIWRQRWSLMTVLYLIIRYIGIPFSLASILRTMPSVSLTDAVSVLQPSHSHQINTLIFEVFDSSARVFTNCEFLGTIMEYAASGTNVALTAMLGVIMIARLHAMYQGSRGMLMLLVIIFLAVNIACAVIAAIGLNDAVAEESILSGKYMCDYVYGGDERLRISIVWMLNTVWEVLALCLSLWVAVKHFRELRRLGPSTGSTINDCFRVLIQSHVLYFASFVGVSCLQFAHLSPEIENLNSIGALILYGVLEILSVVQMFVLGPRLILSVREYHAKFVAYSDAETSINLVVFQEHVHVSTNSTV